MADTQTQSVDIPVSSEVFVHAFEQVPVPLALLDHLGRWLVANASMREILGTRLHPGDDWLLCLESPDEVALAQKAALDGEAQTQIPVQWTASEQALEALASLRCLDGHEPRLLLSLQVLPGSLTPGIQDTVTGLIGHALFMDRLNLAMARQRRNRTELSLMMVSVDNLVPIGAQQGPSIADAVIQEVASRIQSCVRRSDSLARLGGDSFALLFEEVGNSLEAIALAGKIFDALRQEVVLDEGTFSLDVSIGTVMARGEQETWQLMQKVDQALYQAQKNGGNTYELVV